MAKSNFKRRYYLGFLVAIGLSAHGQAVKTESQLRSSILDTAKTQLYVREKAGNNKHPQISLYNRTAKVPVTSPYCASGGYWCHLQNGVRLPLSSPASVRSWFADPKKHVKYKQGEKVQVFDAVSLFTSHVEFVADPAGFDDDDEDFVKLIGFNTTGASTKMQGCYLNYRHKDWIKAVSNHITPYLKNGNPTKPLK